MSIERHRAFIDALCKEGGLGDPRAMYEAADLSVGETKFTLMHGGKSAPDDIVIYGDLGAIPTQHRARVIMRMLKLNMFVSLGCNSPTFAYNPDNGHAMLVGSVPLAHATPEIVHELLTVFAQLAADWRQTYFLGEEKAAASAAKGTVNRLRAHINLTA